MWQGYSDTLDTSEVVPYIPTPTRTNEFLYGGTRYQPTALNERIRIEFDWPIYPLVSSHWMNDPLFSYEEYIVNKSNTFKKKWRSNWFEPALLYITLSIIESR